MSIGFILISIALVLAVVAIVKPNIQLLGVSAVLVCVDLLAGLPVHF